jgi:anti-sigma factor RsiW
VTQNHLLPADIELLVDGDAPAADARVHGHLASCPACQRRVAEAHRIASALEVMPHAKPAFGFSDRVMKNVAVTPPWYAALWQRVQPLVPQSRAVRSLAMLGASVTGVALTLGGLWMVWRADGAAMLGTKAVAEGRVAVAGVADDALTALVGEMAMAALRRGGLPAAMIGGGVFIVAVALAIAGFNALAVASQRRQGKGQ